MADVAALGPTQTAGLADAEGWEVVVVEVALGGLETERVQAHLLTRGAERDAAQRLRLTACEQRRAVRARCDGDLDVDRTDLLRAAAVGADLLNRDALADQRLLELVGSPLSLGELFAIVLGLRVAGVLLDDRGLDGFGLVLAVELVLDGRRR